MWAGLPGTEITFFETDDGVLPRKSMGGAEQIVLPDSLKERVLILTHFAKVAGLPGEIRMFEAVMRTWYWPQIAADVVTTVHIFPECANNFLRLRKRSIPMKVFQGRQRLESVWIYIIGPLPSTTALNRLLLPITDKFT